MRAIRRLVTIGSVVVALLFTGAREGVTAESITWKTYRDQNCGIEFKYPASYQLSASPATDYCALWVRVGGAFELDVEEMDNATRRTMAQSTMEVSPRSFAISRAALHCAADGPDGSTYCTDAMKEVAFKTLQGFNAYEFYLTEVHESYPDEGATKIEKRTKGPIVAVDISDDEVVRVVLVTPNKREGRQDRRLLETMRAVVQTLRVWKKARRQPPQVLEINPFAQAREAFTIRLVQDEFLGPSSRTAPAISMFLIDPFGRRLGVDPATGTSYAEIPAITHWSVSESGFMLQQFAEGRYELQIIGDGASVGYKLVIYVPDQTGKQWIGEHTSRTAEPGAVDRYEIAYSKATTPPVKISEVKDSSRLTLLLTRFGIAVSELLLVDPRGRRTGIDPTASAAYREIPRSSYLEEGAGQRTMVLDIRQPVEGAYVLQVIGTGNGGYGLDIRAWDRSGNVTSKAQFRGIPTVRGAMHRYVLNYAAVASAPLAVAGGFEGERQSDTGTFLTYANPSSAETRLPAGETTFPLLIFYGRSITPITFTALLNDTNISSRFTPAPGASETVFIPLRSGSNTLVLSVDGTAASGRVATDTDRLVFLVP